jgi:hypothetical protein
VDAWALAGQRLRLEDAPPLEEEEDDEKRHGKQDEDDEQSRGEPDGR